MSGRLFITGKLARDALSRTLERIPDFHDYRVLSLGISVAALMNTRFLLHQLQQVPDLKDFDVVVLPGLCRADTALLQRELGVTVVSGPSELQDLPAYLGSAAPSADNSEPDRPLILAEIVDAPLLSLTQIMEKARGYRRSGADYVDLGCTVDTPFPHLEEAVQQLRQEGIRTSIDSFVPEEIRRAVGAGAEMVLSLNEENLFLARELPVPLVILPNPDGSLSSLQANLEQAQSYGALCIADPILDPLGCGFLPSLERYARVRRQFPDLPLLMGVGNVSELTDADSTGLNALLMGMAAELSIDYVLTTEAGPRTRGAVKETVLGRRLIYRALQRGTPPKNLSSDLITVKDLRPHTFSLEEIRDMQQQVRDRNLRIFVSEGRIVVFNRDLWVTGREADTVFRQLDIDDPGHAFYLGRELARAELALKLGKKYLQEQDLNWGYLSDREDSGDDDPARR